MFKSFKEQKELKKKSEGKVVELPNEEEVLEISTEPVDTKIEKEDKNSFEEFKVLYKGQIDDKCLEDYGTIEDEKLWEDTAKELFMASEDYIPEEDDKAEKIEESKKLNEEHQLYYDDIQGMPTSERHLLWKQYHEEDFEDTEEGNNKFWDWAEEEFPVKEIEEESISERYQVREFKGPGAKFGVFDTKEKKFVQKGSKYVMDAACKDLNEKGKVTESSLIKNTLKEMLNKKTESEEDELLKGKDVLYVFEDFDTGIDKDQKNLIKYANETLKLDLDPEKDDLKICSEIQKLTGKEVEKMIRLCYGDEIADKFETFLDNSLETLDTTKIEYIKESIEEGSAIFELKFDCSNEDNFGIGDSMATPLADILTEVANKVASGRFDGPILDINGNKIGSYGIGYEGVETGLSESKKIEESVRDDLVLLRKENKGLYDYVANNYYKMSTEELKEIALDAIYVADKDFEIIDEYLDRVEESVDDDIEKAKKDSKAKGLYCEGQEDSIYYVYSIYTMKDKNDTWMWKDSFESTGVSDKQEAEEKAKAKVKELKDSGEFYDVSYKEWEEDREEDKKYDIDISKYDTIDKIKARIKEINDELAYCRRRDKVCATFGGDQQVYDLNVERDKLRAELDRLKRSKKTEEVEEEITVTDGENLVNSVMVIYVSNQTFMKYYNLDKPLTIEELKNIRLKIKNHEMYVTDIADKLGATEVKAKKELIPNTYIMKIKENDVEDLEEANPDSAAKSILQDFKDLDKLSESQVSEYTFKELNKVINDKGNDFKIQIAGSEDKTNWLNIDKEDLQVIYQALQSRKAK